METDKPEETEVSIMVCFVCLQAQRQLSQYFLQTYNIP